MEDSHVVLNSLPDEILMIIFRKLNSIDVFNCFHGINQRLNRIIQDRIFTNRLTFVQCSSETFTDLLRCDAVRNRICSQISYR